MIRDYFLEWHGLGYQVFIMYSIYTHLHTYIKQPKDYAPKIVEKSILNNFSTKSLRGSALDVPAVSRKSGLSSFSLWILFTEPFFERHIHSRTLPILLGI